MKVAILSHFGGFQGSYALHVGWHERARLLKRYGVDFDFLVNNKCVEAYPNQKNCLPNPPSSKPFEVRVQIFRDHYIELLADYDVILTADLIYQRKGNFLAYNEAMRQASQKLKAWWCHWIHSGWTNRPSALRHPDSLRFTYMPKSFLVYLNSYELNDLARMYATSPKNCWAVYNPKDYRSFNDLHPLTCEIIDRLDLPHKDAVQIFPFCSTRMDAKGIDGVVHAAAALKRNGSKVGLILANSNARKVKMEIDQKKLFIAELGLVDGEDVIWTNDLIKRELPRRNIRELFQLSNYFVFTSWRETVGNVFQEAKTSGCLLLLNDGLPCLREMGGPRALSIIADHKTPGVIDGQTGDFQKIEYNPSTEAYWDEIATSYIIPRMASLEDKWYFCFDHIWERQMWPLLSTSYQMSQGIKFEDIARSPAPEVAVSWQEAFAEATSDVHDKGVICEFPGKK